MRQSQSWTTATDGTIGYFFTPWPALGYSNTAWNDPNNQVFWIKVERSTTVPGTPATDCNTLVWKEDRALPGPP